ncbi:MAG: Stp1/IreP family PP2C-type Ser/Thr phosphatase [Candidatus Thermoplasmatota archaeon]|nr:Stp1/IreP family PP2C-type Ser/Thr phosphatase [Candidatus Thermoplasmatota archaeon]
MEQLSISGNGCTDIGYNRMVNEDYYGMNDFLFVLADGMGGHNAGEIASKLAVEHILRFLDFNWTLDFDEITDEIDIQKKIHTAIIKTNNNIFKESLQRIEYKGMGTTLVLALFQRPNTMHIANIGDSRAYLIRNDMMERLTQDHTITANLLRDGTITQIEAKNHPYRHYLSQSIGTSQDVKAFTKSFSIRSGDNILLCSDGLWNVLTNEEMIRIFKKYSSSKKICNALIARAKELHSIDNISCIVLTISTSRT